MWSRSHHKPNCALDMHLFYLGVGNPRHEQMVRPTRSRDQVLARRIVEPMPRRNWPHVLLLHTRNSWYVLNKIYQGWIYIESITLRDLLSLYPRLIISNISYSDSKNSLSYPGLTDQDSRANYLLLIWKFEGHTQTEYFKCDSL